LQGLTSGSNNLCFGDGVAYAVTSGSFNVMIGQASANNLTTGSNNVGCGVNSLKLLVGGSGNSACGYGALESNTGSNSVGVGFNSGNKSTGNNGVFVGHTAGFSTTTVGGLLGVEITSGANNTMIGQAATSTSATGTYRTAIGSDSRCESNNAVKLGRDTLDVVLLPKMTQAQMATAATTLSAVKGAIVYCTDGGADADHVHFYNGTAWARIN